ncbi:MAG: hypothetical protein QOH71_4268 [Blastocatellia bacterium]|jgi:hypothetical protein|nr:hypothetical protein [Blastocatellia bacterium]
MDYPVTQSGWKNARVLIKLKHWRNTGPLSNLKLSVNYVIFDWEERDDEGRKAGKKGTVFPNPRSRCFGQNGLRGPVYVWD